MTEDVGADGDDGSPSAALVAAGGVLIAVLAALIAALLVGDEVGALLAIGAVTLLFTAVGTGLLLIAREVGSKADDPEEVERRLAEGMGLSEEQIQRRVDRVSSEETVPSQEALDERFYEDGSER